MLEGFILCFVYIVALTIINKLTKIKYTDLLKTEKNLKNGLLLPVGAMTLALTIFALIRGFIPSVFSYSPRFSNIFLWLIPIVVIAGAIARMTQISWKNLSRQKIMYMAIAAVLVGLSEELLVRGLFVQLLHDAGYSLLLVGLISSGVFGIMHAVNFLTGQDAKTTAIQVMNTTIMGINFYALLVLTGSLWVPIALHALHDISLFFYGGEPNKRSSISKTEIVLNLTLLALSIPTTLILWLV